MLKRIKNWLKKPSFFVDSGSVKEAATSEPVIEEAVFGFTLSVEKKDIPSPAAYHSPPAHYYKVTAQSTGGNPEYPAGEPLTVYCAVGMDVLALPSTGSTVPSGGNYTAFRLKEIWDSGKPQGMFAGRERPPHRKVMLCTEFAGAGNNGSSSYCLGVRKSDQETDAWKKSGNGPIIH